MDVKEKLIELLNEVQETGVNETPAGFGYTSDYVENEEVASYLIAHGVTVQEWVSVTERFPERPPDRVDEQGRSWFTPNIDCIVYDGENVFAAHYCFQNKCFWYADTLHPLKNITHWMKMPQPPKGGNMQ